MLFTKVVNVGVRVWKGVSSRDTFGLGKKTTGAVKRSDLSISNSLAIWFSYFPHSAEESKEGGR